jgi:hypothetical protein
MVATLKRSLISLSWCAFPIYFSLCELSIKYIFSKLYFIKNYQ